MFNRILRHSFLKFLLVGGFSTIVNYSTFLLLLNMNIHYQISYTAGFIAGVFFGLSFNVMWTFKSHSAKNDWILKMKYFSVYTLTLLMGMALLAFLVNAIELGPKIANFLVIIFTTLSNYFLLRKFIFKKATPIGIS